MKKGSLHSIETMGLVDGPGIRTVFFLQGCPLKCLYCHNPDSQHFMGENTITVDEIVSISKRYMEYYKATDGGVTFSGGEPLMQGAFLVEALTELNKLGIHTCIDTSGYGISKYYSEILKRTDLILLDVKQVEAKAHERLVGRPIDGILSFIETLRDYKGRVVIRHVMVPGETDNRDSMEKLLKIIQPIIKSVDKIEILPYHKNGTEKYSQLNILDPLFGVPAMSPEAASDFEKWINEELQLKIEKQLTEVILSNRYHVTEKNA